MKHRKSLLLVALCVLSSSVALGDGGQLPAGGLTRVNHDGTLVGSGTTGAPSGINPAQAITVMSFTGSAAVTPSALSTVVPDYTCDASCRNAAELRIDCTDGPGICGIAGIAGFVDGGGALLASADGALFSITNISSIPGHDITLSCDAGVSASATRFACLNPIVVAPLSTAFFRYDGLSKKLRSAASENANLLASRFSVYVQHETTTGPIQDEALASNASIIVLDGSDHTNLSGITAGYEGQYLDVVCASGGSTPCTLQNEDTGTTAADRIVGQSGQDVTLSANGNGGAALRYLTVAGNSRWRVTALNSGNYKGTQSFVGATFSGAAVLNGSAKFGAQIIVTGSIGPTALNGTSVNNYTPPGFAATSLVRQDASADTTITGFGVEAAGQTFTILNTSTSHKIVLTNDDAASLAGNHTLLPGGHPWSIPPSGALDLRYSSTATAYRPMSTGNYDPWFGAVDVANLATFHQGANFNGTQINGLLDPSLRTDAATKGYVDDSITTGAGIAASGAVAGTTGQLAQFTSAHVVGNYGGSGPCGAGLFGTTLTGAGVLTCTSLVVSDPITLTSGTIGLGYTAAFSIVSHALDLATLVTAGSCTYCNATLDKYGRATAFSSATTPVVPSALAGTGSNLQIATGSHTVGDYAGSGPCAAGTLGNQISTAGALGCSTAVTSVIAGAGTTVSTTSGAATVTHTGPYSQPMQSGRYYFVPNAAATSTSNTLGNGTLRAVPFWIPNAITVQRIGAEITGAGDVGSKYRIGVYADDGTGRPGALLLDAGTIAADSATVQEIGSLSLALAPGMYWIAAAVQLVTVTQPTVRTINTATGVGGLDAGTTMPSSNTIVQGRQMSGVTGALATWSDAGTISAGIPRVFIKVN